MDKKEQIKFLKEELERLEKSVLIAQRDLNMANGAIMTNSSKEMLQGQKTLKNNLAFVKSQIRYTQYLISEIEEIKK